MPAARASKSGATGPHAKTGGYSHVRGSTAELEGTVNTGNLSTTYFFEYGPTSALGTDTPVAGLPAAPAIVRVGQIVSGLLVGEHYRLVAVNAVSESIGAERTFGSKARALKFVLAKPATTIVYRHGVTLTGALVGPGDGNVPIVLQSSSYPFLAPFADVGAAIVTGPTGTFSFRVASLSANTQFRVITLGARPLYSSVVTQSVMPRVVLEVRRSKAKGLVRLFGTVTPAETGAHLLLQLSRPARPGRSEKASERTIKFATQFSTVVRRGTKSISRFSIVVKVLRGGRYRAFVELKQGPLVSGSSSTVVLSAAANDKNRKQR